LIFQFGGYINLTFEKGEWKMQVGDRVQIKPDKRDFYRQPDITEVNPDGIFYIEEMDALNEPIYRLAGYPLEWFGSDELEII
jgi:hypothetical protein